MLQRILDALTSPSLPPQILLITGAVATLIVVTGVGIWGLIGAWQAFVYMVWGPLD